ncbi:NXPE family member 4-like [Ylistrum balloti]|uniref:NXPE family member 4-like n=1 Tax=Ylistrum balloti TaxID=509963 RepID=UPI002905B31A|nr:NXPE family member 4-like [Ylistrum balloti]
MSKGKFYMETHEKVQESTYDLDNMVKIPAYTITKAMEKQHKSKRFIDIDLKSIPDPEMSSVKSISFNRTYTVGDHFHVKIILRDVLGRRLQSGGDVLRIWLVNYKLEANVIGTTTYIGNGTYIGQVLLPWKGHATLLVSIAQTRQAITSVMSVINGYGNLYEMYGLFSNEVDPYHGETEKTLCSTVANPRMGKDVCNLTSQNFGYSWFCAKPKCLRCQDWKAVRGRMLTYLPEYIVNKTRKQHMVLKKRVELQIHGETETMPRSRIPCENRPKTSTWTDQVPTGFYFKNTWNFINCRSRTTWTEQTYQQCLKGRHLLIIGDSTTRQIFGYLTDQLKLSFYPAPRPKGPYVHFVFGYNRPNNVSVSWFPHEHPFFNAQYLLTRSMQSASKRLDNIGRHNNSVILIHLWAHHVRTPPHVFRQHVRGISNSVQRLLLRSPKVSIFIKGPHATLDRKCIIPVDYLKSIHKQIWVDEFRDLQDKVIFLDVWDMTAGSENVYIHPEIKLVSDIVHTFMSYACPS